MKTFDNKKKAREVKRPKGPASSEGFSWEFAVKTDPIGKTQIFPRQFDERGLIPAVVQDLRSRKVLTLAYMNRESLEITLREGRTCFYSRSRGTLWRKGETSGNVQRVASIRPDCDGDALLVEVVKDG